MNRTTLLSMAWIVSAAGAVGLGFLGVSLVDASPSPAASSVAIGGGAGGTGVATDNGGSGGSSTPAAPGVPVSGEYQTAGGLVYARCLDGAAELISAPAVGWWSEDSGASDQVEFRDGAQKIEVRVACGAAGPEFTVEGPRADDDLPGPAPATSTDAPEPSGSGGHGSDDSGGSGSGNSGSGNSGSGNSGSGGGGGGQDDSGGRGSDG